MSLLWAEKAIEYVRTTVGVRSDNREWDRRVGVVDVGAARLEGLRRSGEAAHGWQNAVAAEASAYRDLKAGNCLEMAKVAFVYLAQNGIRPIEVAYLTPLAAARRVRLTGTTQSEDVDPDHAFVIIGRKIDGAERRARQDGEIAVAPYATWNFGTVICDPWSKRAYFGDRLGIEMQLINRVSGESTQLSSDPRLEEGQQWTA